MAQYVIGIDGGGTRTRAAVVGYDGQLLGTGTSAASNYDDVGVEIAQQNIGLAVGEATALAGVERASCAAAFLGMAGVTSATDQEHIRQIALRLQLAPDGRIGVDHDCRVALAGGLEGRPGIVQIVGTGSSCYGRNRAGKSWLAGGRGHLIADEGSGYWLGIEAMRAAVRAYDGRSAPTVLLETVLRGLGIASIEEIMHRLYVTRMSRAEIAGLAPLVLNAATAHDLIALQIIRRGANEIAQCVAAVARRLGMADGECEVCLVGGLVQGSVLVASAIDGAVKLYVPQSRVQLAALPPALGAAILALELAGIAVTAPMLRQLYAARSQV